MIPGTRQAAQGFFFGLFLMFSLFIFHIKICVQAKADETVNWQQLFSGQNYSCTNPNNNYLLFGFIGLNDTDILIIKLDYLLI